MWPFRTDARVLDLTRKLKSAANAITALRGLLAEASEALAAEQRRAQRAKEPYDRIRAVEQDLTVQRIAELDDLREQVEALREQVKRDAAVSAAVVARLHRRWDGHTAVCPQAQAADDHSADKDRENSI
jgi:chromosome segregation ATPase